MKISVKDKTPRAKLEEMVEETLKALEEVPDFRGRKGRQFELKAVLALVILGLGAGKKSLAEIARFGKRRVGLIRALGLPRAPSHPTIWRVVTGVDREAMRAVLKRVGEAMVRAWQTLVVGIDGKQMRGSRQGNGKEAHVVMAWEHGSGVVLDSLMSPGPGTELATGRTMAEELFTEGTENIVVTGDALYANQGLAKAIVGAGQDYVFKVKKTSRSFSRTSGCVSKDEGLPACVERG